MTVTQIPADVTRRNAQVPFLIGFRDGETAAKSLSVADARERITAIGPLATDVYTRGFRTALEVHLAKRGTGEGVRRGQGGTCTGLLTITLSGPKGSGKGMLKRILEPLLPLLPISRFEIVVDEE